MSGCKLLHEEHTFGDPGPYWAGPDDTQLSDDGNLPPDENDLLEQVKQLKLKEEALAKKSRIENLALEVAERQCRIEQLTKLQGPTTGEHSLSAEHPKAKKPAAVVDFPSTYMEHTGPNSSKDHGASPTPHGHDTKTPSVPTPLDFLLAGYARNPSSDQQSLQSQQIPAQQMNLNNVLNPDGPLSGPLASQEFSMFLKPAQLAKGERVLWIVDFVDKIVTNTEDRTISDMGNTKIVISSGPKNTIKIMELSSKFSWPSILRYDDEFHHIQVAYCQRNNQAKKRGWLGGRIITPCNVCKTSQILRNPLKFAFLTMFGHR